MRADRLEKLLQSLAQRDVGAPPAEFSDRLEQRLRARMELRWRDESEARRPWWGSVPRPRAGFNLVAAAAAVVVVVAVSLFGDAMRPDASDPSNTEGKVVAGAAQPPVLDEAVQVTLVLPDGRVVDASQGDTLATGTVVHVGAAGSAVAGGERLDPGTSYRVEDGGLVALPPSAGGLPAP